MSKYTDSFNKDTLGKAWESMERPIIFSGEMVKAILEGRKTMTRRIVKPQFILLRASFLGEGIRSLGDREVKCPYGQIGDRLWVRETWKKIGDKIEYAASPDDTRSNGTFIRLGAWKPSIHMPRQASRITLEITDVRVEKLQSISEEDAKAEGADKTHIDDLGQTWATYKRGFESLWTSLHGTDNPKSWEANPWVFVLDFKRIIV